MSVHLCNQSTSGHPDAFPCHEPSTVCTLHHNAAKTEAAEARGLLRELANLINAPGTWSTAIEHNFPIMGRVREFLDPDVKLSTDLEPCGASCVAMSTPSGFFFNSPINFCGQHVMHFTCGCYAETDIQCMCRLCEIHQRYRFVIVEVDGQKARWDTSKGILIDAPFGPWPRPE